MPDGAHLKTKFKMARWKKILLWSTAFVGVVALSLGGFAWYEVHHLTSNITTQKIIQTPSRPKKDPQVPASAENILLMGSDARPSVEGARSDTAILLHISASHKYAYGASIPRDSMVHIPSCPDGHGHTIAANFNMFNAAFAEGGAPCSVKTVESITGVHVDHFVVISFTSFQTIVDALGGVQVCLTQNVNDPESHLNITKGTHTLNGKQALAYVRVRHNIGAGTGDIGRMERQQAFLLSVVKKMLSQNYLTSPVELLKILNAVTKNLTVDPALDNVGALKGLASALQSIGVSNIHFLTTPFRLYPPDPNRIEFTSQAKKLWPLFIHDKPLTPAFLKVSLGNKAPSGGTAPRGVTPAPTSHSTTSPSKSSKSASPPPVGSNGDGTGVNLEESGLCKG